MSQLPCHYATYAYEVKVMTHGQRRSRHFDKKNTPLRFYALRKGKETAPAGAVSSLGKAGIYLTITHLGADTAHEECGNDQ